MFAMSQRLDCQQVAPNRALFKSFIAAALPYYHINNMSPSGGLSIFKQINPKFLLW
jgi:hypothetical protein